MTPGAVIFYALSHNTYTYAHVHTRVHVRTYTVDTYTSTYVHSHTHDTLPLELFTSSFTYSNVPVEKLNVWEEQGTPVSGKPRGGWRISVRAF